MNYAAHYDRLIARARNRALAGYQERHHVIPKCMGGTDAKENLVSLTAEEHYVAHQLLVKMNPGHSGIANAAVFMEKRASGNKSYGWLRRRMSEAMRGHHRARGYRHTLEARARISAANKGRKFTEEQKAKLSATRKTRPPISEETREKLRISSSGFKHSVETRERLSQIKLGIPRSIESILKQKETVRKKKELKAEV